MQHNKFIFDGRGVMALLVGMFAGILVSSVINVSAMFIFNVNLQYKDWYLVLSNALSFLAAIFAFDYFVARRDLGKPLKFNISSPNFGTYLLILPLMFGMMLIAEFITGKIPITGPVFGELYKIFSGLMEQMTRDKATLILLAVVMAPVFEEIVFRGIIQKGLINKGMNPMKAILIASIVFGLVHGNPWQFVGAVLLGCVLGLVYYKTKSLLLPILLHAFNNLCSALLIFYADTESFSDAFNVPDWILLIAGILIFTAFLYLFMKKYRVHYAEN